MIGNKSILTNDWSNHLLFAQALCVPDQQGNNLSNYDDDGDDYEEDDDGYHYYNAIIPCYPSRPSGDMEALAHCYKKIILDKKF